MDRDSAPSAAIYRSPHRRLRDHSQQSSTRSVTHSTLPSSAIHAFQPVTDTQGFSSSDHLSSFIVSEGSHPRIISSSPVNSNQAGWRNRIKQSMTDVDAAQQDGEDWSNVIALIDEPPQILPASHSIDIGRHSRCSSCGTESTVVGQDRNEVTFVELHPCQHLLCSACLTSLINATSNDPPRRGECFACNTLVHTFVGASFDDVVDEDVGGDANVEMDARYSTPSRKDATARNAFDTPETIAALSPFRKLDWSREYDASPASTPGSAGSGMKTRLSLSLLTTSSALSRHEIPSPTDYPVIRVDNVPWSITVAQVVEWFPATVGRIEGSYPHELFIHILCNRADAKTLNQLYIELPDLASAHAFVRLKNGKKIVGRAVSVGLSSQAELLEQIFPGWTQGFTSVNALSDPLAMDVSRGDRYSGSAVLITNEDILGLIELCKLEVSHAKRSPERAFFNVVSILEKLPWHQPEVYDDKLVARIFKLVEHAIESLVRLRYCFSDDSSHDFVMHTLIESALHCPAFRSTQKSKLTSLAGISFDPAAISPSASTTSPSSIQPHPILDRLKSLPTPIESNFGAFTFLSQIPSSPSSPSAAQQRRHSSSLTRSASFSSPSLVASPSRLRFNSHLTPMMVDSDDGDEDSEDCGGMGKEDEQERRMAKEFGVDIELVSKIRARLSKP